MKSVRVVERNDRQPPALIEGKDMITAVITGHVDHGKSTITGHLMYQMDLVSDRELRKYVHVLS